MVFAEATFEPIVVDPKTKKMRYKTDSEIIIDIHNIAPLGNKLNANMSVLELFRNSYYWKDLPREFFARATYFNQDIIKNLIKLKKYSKTFRLIDYTVDWAIEAKHNVYSDMIDILEDLLTNKETFDEAKKRLRTYLDKNYTIYKSRTSRIRIFLLLAEFDKDSFKYLDEYGYIDELVKLKKMDELKEISNFLTDHEFEELEQLIEEEKKNAK